MIRFRYSGTGWRVSAAIRTFGVQVETALPNRHDADGTIASSSHVKWPDSDHGRDPNGWVRAIDVGESYGDAVNDAIAESLRLGRDPRLKYVISDARMFSSYPAHGYAPWTWRPYSGRNPHAGHFHLSVQDWADDDDELWDIDLGAAMAFMEVTDMQQALVDAGFDLGTSGPNGDGVDDQWGPKSQQALTEALTPGSSTGPGDEYATVEWVRGFVGRKTRGMMTYGESYSSRKAGE